MLHRGLFYKPGFEKAVLSVRGLRQIVEFCQHHRIPHEICGKIMVGTTPEEAARLDALAAEITRLGGRIQTGSRVTAMRRDSAGWVVRTAADDLRADFVITCGGPHFVRHLIYPMPDPAFPFLGVHFTRLIHGGIEAGPNAVLAFAREGYSWGTVNLRDRVGSLAYPGLWRFLARHPQMYGYEIYRSLSKREFCRPLQRLAPQIAVDDLVPGGEAFCAQALSSVGRLVEDFEFMHGAGLLHVVNAPTSAATA